MLTPFQKLQLKILKYGFIYLPSYPFQVNINTGQIKPHSVNLKPTFVSFIILMIFNTILGSLGFIFGWQYVELARAGKMKSSGLIFLLFCGIELTISGIVLLILKENSVITGLRNMVVIKSKLYNDCPSIKQRKYLIDIALCPVMIACIFAPHVVLLMSMVKNVDPYYHIINIILKNSGNSRLLEYVKCILLYVIRPILIASSAERARTIAYLIFALCLNWCTLLNILNAMLNSNSIKISSKLRTYHSFMLAYKLMDKCLSDMLSVGMSIFFWLMVPSLWVVIQYSHKIPVIPLCWLILCTTTGNISVWLALQMVSKINELSALVVLKQIHKTKHCYGTALLGSFKYEAKINWKIAKAIKPVVVTYKPVSKIDKVFCLEYFGNMSEQVADLLMIF